MDVIAEDRESNHNDSCTDTAHTHIEQQTRTCTNGIVPVISYVHTQTPALMLNNRIILLSLDIPFFPLSFAKMCTNEKLNTAEIFKKTSESFKSLQILFHKSFKVILFKKLLKMLWNCKISLQELLKASASVKKTSKSTESLWELDTFTKMHKWASKSLKKSCKCKDMKNPSLHKFLSAFVFQKTSKKHSIEKKQQCWERDWPVEWRAVPADCWNWWL